MLTKDGETHYLRKQFGAFRLSQANICALEPPVFLLLCLNKIKNCTINLLSIKNHTPAFIFTTGIVGEFIQGDKLMPEVLANISLLAFLFS